MKEIKDMTPEEMDEVRELFIREWPKACNSPRQQEEMEYWRRKARSELIQCVILGCVSAFFILCIILDP